MPAGIRPSFNVRGESRPGWFPADWLNCGLEWHSGNGASENVAAGLK